MHTSNKMLLVVLFGVLISACGSDQKALPPKQDITLKANAHQGTCATYHCLTYGHTATFSVGHHDRNKCTALLIPQELQSTIKVHTNKTTHTLSPDARLGRHEFTSTLSKTGHYADGVARDVCQPKDMIEKLPASLKEGFGCLGENDKVTWTKHDIPCQRAFKAHASVDPKTNQLHLYPAKPNILVRLWHWIDVIINTAGVIVGGIIILLAFGLIALLGICFFLLMGLVLRFSKRKQ